MSDHVRYQIHLRRLNQIKQRVNHYPVYDIKVKGKQSPSPKKMKIDKIMSEIKTNKANISLVKKELKKKRPVNFNESDIYIYDREVENFQKQFMDQLIDKNKILKKQVKEYKELKPYNYYKHNS